MRSRFNLVAAAWLAVASLATAQRADPDFDYITKPEPEEKVPAGKTYTIEWQLQPNTASGTVKILLLSGENNGVLDNPVVIATGVDNTALKYDWAVNSTLGSAALYGLEIALESDPAKHFQYSNPFHITGGSAAVTTTTSPPTSTSGVTLSGSTDIGASTTPPTTSQTTTTPAGNGSIISSSTSKPSGTTTPNAGGRLAVASFALIGGVAFTLLGL